MKRTLAALVAVAALAGCGAATTTTSPSSERSDRSPTADVDAAWNVIGADLCVEIRAAFAAGVPTDDLAEVLVAYTADWPREDFDRLIDLIMRDC